MDCRVLHDQLWSGGRWRWSCAVRWSYALKGEGSLLVLGTGSGGPFGGGVPEGMEGCQRRNLPVLRSATLEAPWKHRKAVKVSDVCGISGMCHLVASRQATATSPSKVNCRECPVPVPVQPATKTDDEATELRPFVTLYQRFDPSRVTHGAGRRTSTSSSSGRWHEA